MGGVEWKHERGTDQEDNTFCCKREGNPKAILQLIHMKRRIPAWYGTLMPGEAQYNGICQRVDLQNPKRTDHDARRGHEKGIENS